MPLSVPCSTYLTNETVDSPRRDDALTLSSKTCRNDLFSLVSKLLEQRGVAGGPVNLKRHLKRSKQANSRTSLVSTPSIPVFRSVPQELDTALGPAEFLGETC